MQNKDQRNERTKNRSQTGTHVRMAMAVMVAVQNGSLFSTTRALL